MNSEKIVFSVIVPCFNGAEHIDSCLGALSKQELHVPWEVVFVDDGSNDESWSKAESWIQRFDRRGCLKLLRNPRNQGLPMTRKVGLREAAGDHIAFCDIDDVMSPGFLAVAYRAFCEAPIDILVSPVQRFRNEVAFNLDAYELTVRSSEEALKQFGDHHFGGGWLWNKIWKRQLIDEAFGRLTDLGRFDVDYELTTLGYALSDFVGSASGFAYGYRDTPGSMVNSKKPFGFGFTESLNNYLNLCRSGLSNKELEIVRPVFLRRMFWSGASPGDQVVFSSENARRCRAVLRGLHESEPEFMIELIVAQREIELSHREHAARGVSWREFLRLLEGLLKRLFRFYMRK